MCSLPACSKVTSACCLASFVDVASHSASRAVRERKDRDLSCPSANRVAVRSERACYFENQPEQVCAQSSALPMSSHSRVHSEGLFGELSVVVQELPVDIRDQLANASYRRPSVRPELFETLQDSSTETLPEQAFLYSRCCSVPWLYLWSPKTSLSKLQIEQIVSS